MDDSCAACTEAILLSEDDCLIILTQDHENVNLDVPLQTTACDGSTLGQKCLHDIWTLCDNTYDAGHISIEDESNETEVEGEEKKIVYILFIIIK